MARVLLILALLVVSRSVWASSCCGQSPSSFTVLSLEQRLNLTTSYALSQSQGRVFDSDEFHVWNDKKRQIQSWQLNVASSFMPRHQVFAVSSFMTGRYSDSINSGSSSDMSDTQLGYTYEVLPEYSFSYWKPVVYLSAIANVPTGKSIYEQARLSEGTDVTGHNQWGAGVGLTLRKVYFPLTITLQAKSLKIFSKSFGVTKVSDFYDNSLALLFNYALGFEQLTLNLGATTNQLTERKIDPSETTSGVMQNTTLSIGLSKHVSDAWSAGLSYADQTLVGRARNSILNKTYSLNLNYNYF